ncbi:hypothetical protein [Burkholderia sp. NLJ2]|uniref:hypothetical protein n=1 Tax=Burkholderia sp. NLJ2 TaxID=3090699 RepID=UPI003C6C21D6
MKDQATPLGVTQGAHALSTCRNATLMLAATTRRQDRSVAKAGSAEAGLPEKKRQPGWAGVSLRV